MSDSTVEPPNSRLFILCSKSVTDEELREAFNKYGHIEDVWIVKDKMSGDNKGVVYIKYIKSSEAALAMEEMNGKTLNSNQKPLKIMIAHSREQGSRREDDTERLVRLFIVVPKTATEDEVREHFRQFGDLEYVSIVRNRETGESKGFAYVKYHRPYHAAKAFEDCYRSYKAMFARPREPKNVHANQYDSGLDRFNFGSSYQMHDCSGGDSKWGESFRLTAFVPLVLREQHVYRLFDIVPGLELCRLIHEPRSYNTGMQKVLLQYSNMQFAQHAYEKINGLEYPLGHRITVKMESESQDRMNSGYRGGPGMGMGKEGGGGGGGGTTTTISSAELATLTKALAKAESIIKAAGLASSGGESGGFDPKYCTVKLPPPQPVSSAQKPTERLFIVCQPGLPPMYALRDVFGRFGNLVEVYVLNGKNCGYVSYSSKESADSAIDTLHLQEVCGMRLKVMKAEPPPGGPNKRAKVDSPTT